MPFPFFALAPELRIRILILTLASPTPISIANPLSFTTSTYHALLLVSHQLYDEARPLYFSENTFHLQVARDISNIQYFFGPDFQKHRVLIRDLEVDTHRWGPKTFFLDSVIPALQEMVLVGNLRRLEVKGRRSQILSGLRPEDFGAWNRYRQQATGFLTGKPLTLDDFLLQDFQPQVGYVGEMEVPWTEPKEQDAATPVQSDEALTGEAVEQIRPRGLRDCVSGWDPVRQLILLMEDPYLEHVKFQVERVPSHASMQTWEAERPLYTEDISSILRRPRRKVF